MVEPPVASVCWTMIRHISADGKQVHLYGGAAAMRSDVMPLRDRKCIVSELFVAFSFSFVFAFALADPFPLPLLLPVMWKWAVEELVFAFAPGSLLQCAKKMQCLQSCCCTCWCWTHYSTCTFVPAERSTRLDNDMSNWEDLTRKATPRQIRVLVWLLFFFSSTLKQVLQ